MLTKALQQRALAQLARNAAVSRPSIWAHTVRQVSSASSTPAPRAGDGPLMERRANRELPDVRSIQFSWFRSLPIFVALIALCSAAIFNYQKMTSSVTNSTLYALRTSPRARAILGNEIYFKQRIPWISGEMNQLHGRINISFSVKGDKGEAVMTFTSYRYTDRGQFETMEWSLTTPDGKRIDLLDGGDPMGSILNTALELDEEDFAIQTRGYRQKPLGK
ncbi:cytochrome oxidase assembly protein 1 [Ceratocystis pirilliformis]|uniref:Cytochrome oxidase assembly protein 1 n=1 Tax=Ceratocystis pirilliformis TaxID=259994 RepID=A0ABR3Z387_9PEZI